MSRFLRAFGVVPVAAFVLAVASGPAAGQAVLNIGWVKATANLTAHVAEEVGPKHGLKVVGHNFGNSNDIVTAMIGGQLDIGLLTPIHLIRAIDTGLDLVQIAGNARRNTAVVVAASLNLKQDDWAGLKEAAKKRKLRIAASRGSISELTAIAEFARNGLDVDRDFELVNMLNFGQHPQALRSGNFDIVITLDPLATAIAAERYGVIFNYPYSSPAGDINTNWVVTRAWLGKNRERAQAFVATLVESVKLLGNQKLQLEAAQKVTGVKPEILLPSFANNRYDLGNAVPQTQELAKIAFARKFTTRNVADDVPRAIDTSFLKPFGIDR